MLAICAAIQVLGHWYETSSGERVDGVGLLDVTTSPQDKRTIGEVVSEPLLAGLRERLDGFRKPPRRNGSGTRRRAAGEGRSRARATGRATASTARCRAASSPPTCMGPCLARNPELADHLLSKVVGDLAPLEIDEVAQLRRERLAAPRRV